MNNRGFSLTELIVVILLITIMLVVATLNFNDWQKKYNIEGQVKEMLVDLTDVRTRAIATKQQHRVILNPTSYTFVRYSSEFDVAGTQVFSKSVKYPIQQFSSGAYSTLNNLTLTFDDRGYTSSLVTLAVGAGLGNPAYNCIGIHYARVNMGRINGNTCEYQ
jgi:type IV fimbrial biogenesis protein FimT